jgi:uncharacterized membrane protein
VVKAEALAAVDLRGGFGLETTARSGFAEAAMALRAEGCCFFAAGLTARLAGAAALVVVLFFLPIIFNCVCWRYSALGNIPDAKAAENERRENTFSWRRVNRKISSGKSSAMRDGRLDTAGLTLSFGFIMSDPVAPNPASPSSREPEAETPPVPPGSVGSGLQRNVAAMLACFPLIGGIIFLILEKKDSFVRFYAMQSVFLGGVGVLFSIASRIILLCVGGIPVLGLFVTMALGLVSALIGLATLVFWIVTMIKAYGNREWEIPFLGALARKQLESGKPSAS